MQELTALVPYKGSEPYIFISYAHKNGAEVTKIAARLQQQGFRVWYDGGIDPGIEWAETIAERVANCGYFIAFITPEYIASSNCQDELSFARDKDKKRLLVYLSDVTLPDGMSMRLNRLQAIHKYKYKKEDEFYEKLFLADGIRACMEAAEAEEGGADTPAATAAPAVPETPVPAAPVAVTEKSGAIGGISKKTIGIIAGAGAALIAVVIVLTVCLVSASGGSKVQTDAPAAATTEAPPETTAAPTTTTTTAPETPPRRPLRLPRRRYHTIPRCSG